MQVLHYAKDEHYWAHHDYFDPNIYRGFVTSPGQNRFITVFFYLSNVEEGGETVSSPRNPNPGTPTPEH